MRSGDEKSSSAWWPLVVAGAVAVLSFVGVVDLVRYVAELGPRVGDIVSFAADPGAAQDVVREWDVKRADRSSCRLDLTTIRRSGGSVVVEERQPGPPRLYRVHWSGVRSSPGAANCGTSSDLLLEDVDIELLALAAGGYGTDHRRFALIGAWTKSAPAAQ